MFNGRMFELSPLFFLFLFFTICRRGRIECTNITIHKKNSKNSVDSFPTPGANPGRDGLATKDVKIGSKNIMSLNYYEYLLNCEAPGGTMKGAIIIRNEPRRIQSKVE